MSARKIKAKDHSCLFSFGVHANCVCGWRGSNFWGKGAQGHAAYDYHDHVAKCERAKEPTALEKAMLAAPDAGGV